MGGNHSRHEEHNSWQEEAANRERAEAEERANASRRAAEEETARARAMQAEAEERANTARRVAEEETARERAMQAEIERLAAEAERAVVEARRRAKEEADARRQREEEERRVQEEMIKIAEENARKLREAEEVANQARLAREEAERRAEAVKREAAAAEKEARRERAAQEEANRLAQAAEKEIQEARAAREEAEMRLKESSRPVERLSELEFATTRRRYQYEERIFHIAIVGLSGSGKSSLINAFCGLSNSHPGAAKTGIIETTSQVTRYPDPNPLNLYAWYDVPGAGTLDVPDWQYFNEQGLYVFDCIIVLFDLRFTASDAEVLKNCERFNIPSFIVRSKSNQHIQNLAHDTNENSSDGEDDEDENNKGGTDFAHFADARDTFIEETRESVKANLEKAGLPQRRVYLVSKEAMLAVVTGKVPQGVIDEYDLLQDITAVPISN